MKKNLFARRFLLLLVNFCDKTQTSLRWELNASFAFSCNNFCCSCEITTGCFSLSAILTSFSLAWRAFFQSNPVFIRRCPILERKHDASWVTIFSIMGNYLKRIFANHLCRHRSDVSADEWDSSLLLFIQKGQMTDFFGEIWQTTVWFPSS